jgi:hypothetical protein
MVVIDRYDTGMIASGVLPSIRRVPSAVRWLTCAVSLRPTVSALAKAAAVRKAEFKEEAEKCWSSLRQVPVFAA